MPGRSPLFYNAQPALLAAGAVASGILLGSACAAVTVELATTVTAAALLIGGGCLWKRATRLVSARELGWTLAPLLALAALGTLRTVQDRALPPAHVGHVTAGTERGEGLPVVLEGRVREAPRRRRQSTGLRVSVHRLFAPSDMQHADTMASSGIVSVRFRPSAWDDAPVASFPPVEEGDLVRLHGELRAPPERRNPADFDYGAYLRRNGVHATMSIYDPAHVQVMGRQRTVTERVVVPSRRHVERQLARHVPDREARAVLRALLLGDRGLLSGAAEEHFARAGLMHLLAVSGLHVLLVGWLFYQLLRAPLLRLGLRWYTVEWVRSVLTLAVLVLYVLLAGAPASATRAALMAALLMGATLAQRPGRSLNALGAAATLLLLWRPPQLFEAGFQLSFAAVGAIVLLVPVMERALPAVWEERPALRWAARSTLTTLAATLGTLPVLLAHFGQVPFAGLVLNLWAIPLTAVALASALATVVLGGWAAPVAALAGATADLAARALLWTAQLGDTQSAWTLLRLPEAGPGLLVASTTGVLALAAWPHPRRRWRLVVLMLAIAAAGVGHDALRKAPASQLDAVFLDVGHGDAVVLSLPGGAHVLVDAGGRSPVSDVGRSVIEPHLAQHGIDRLDAVVLSHPDGDHLGGLPSLLRRVEIGRLITGGDTAHSALFAETQHLIDSLGVPIRTARAGDTLRLGPHVVAQVLAPTRRLVETASENDASVVFRLRHGATRWLFTGDAEAHTEALLAEHYGSFLRSDVIKIGHHGSSTSSTPAFVRAAASENAFAVASSGRRFGLPNRDILARWDSAGAVSLTTADEGAVWLRSDGHTVRRVRWRE